MTVEPKIALRLQFLARVVRKECQHTRAVVTNTTPLLALTAAIGSLPLGSGSLNLRSTYRSEPT